MAKPPPKWQHELQTLPSQHRPWNRGLGRRLPIPLYVERWLFWASEESENAFFPRQLAADLLTKATLDYAMQHAPPLPYKVAGGVAVDPPDTSSATIADLATRTGSGVCVFNSAFAWLFDIGPEVAKDAFRAWVAEAFALSPSRKPSRHGWPVVVLTSGHWPIDPRLLPGTPVTLPELADPALIKPPPRPVLHVVPQLDDDIDIPF